MPKINRFSLHFSLTQQGCVMLWRKILNLKILQITPDSMEVKIFQAQFRVKIGIEVNPEIKGYADQLMNTE